jgi:hypothetical protein
MGIAKVAEEKKHIQFIKLKIRFLAYIACSGLPTYNCNSRHDETLRLRVIINSVVGRKGYRVKITSISPIVESK